MGRVPSIPGEKRDEARLWALGARLQEITSHSVQQSLLDLHGYCCYIYSSNEASLGPNTLYLPA